LSDGVLKRIRRAVRERRYDFADHLLAEVAAYRLTTDDALEVLLTGDLDSTYSDDPRGIRYVVRGNAQGFQVDVVCRFHHNRIVLIIITCYIVD